MEALSLLWSSERDLSLSRGRSVGRVFTLFPPQVGSVPGRAPGAMAPGGRKRKAEAAGVAAAEKREKLAGGQKGVEVATVVIEHW